MTQSPKQPAPVGMEQSQEPQSMPSSQPSSLNWDRIKAGVKETMEADWRAMLEEDSKKRK